MKATRDFHYANIIIRRDGQEIAVEADWLKQLQMRSFWLCKNNHLDIKEQEVLCWKCGEEMIYQYSELVVQIEK